MKKFKISFLLAALLMVAGHSAFALNCAPSRNSQGPSDDCYSSVTVASNETTLVSLGTVLVYDVANAQVSSVNGAFQVRVATASAQGVRVAGVAQTSITSGSTALVLVRGRGDVATNVSTSFASGDPLFVGVSGDATATTSTAQTQLGFALDTRVGAAGTPSRSTNKAYITIV